MIHINTAQTKQNKKQKTKKKTKKTAHNTLNIIANLSATPSAGIANTLSDNKENSAHATQILD